MVCGNNTDMNPPRTIHVYLHPPLSERVVLLCPDFRVADLELSEKKGHTGQSASGFLILHGEDLQAPDYHTVTFSPVQGGLPVYCLNSGPENGTRLSMEAFSSFDRVPVTYARVTVTNHNNYAIQDALGLLPRSNSNDNALLGYVDTGYSVYRPNFRNWLTFRCLYCVDGQTARDPSSAIRLADDGWRWISEAEQPILHEAYDYFRADFRLEPGESRSFDLCFTTGVLPDTVDYDGARAETVRRWEEELKPLELLPDTDAPRIGHMYRHLAAQCLQMLARYQGSDLITPRQGDIGRFVWPWEAANMLTALDRAGLRKYTGDAYRYFLEKWLVREGEDRGKIMSCHQQWGNLNGSLLWGISDHLLHTDDREEFERFKPELELMLDWVERERRRGDDMPECRYKGIFPVGKGTDWTQLAQHWCFTDSQNVFGEETMAKLYAHFGDEKAAYVQSCAENYRKTMLDIMAEIYAGHENDRCYLLPHQLGVPFEDTMTYCWYICGAPYLMFTGLIPSDSHMFEQMEAYFDEHGMFENGLAGRMTNLSSNDYGLYGDVYYTVNGEMMWIKAWKERGENEKAERMMRSLMRYGVTSEYIVSERYSPLEEWYSPWTPNASSSGRLMHVLLDYYGERRK